MKFRRLVTSALLVLLLAAPLASGMLVVCFGSDGHVAVETADACICCAEPDAARDAGSSRRAETVRPDEAPCCEDVELSLDSATLTAAVHKLLPAAVVACVSPGRSARIQGVAAGAPPFETESSVAASLRTVVLRT